MNYVGRRVVSSDREGAVTPSRGSTYDQSHPPPVRRVVSSDGRVGPPARRMPQQGPHGGGHRGVRTSDGLDSSYSESELNGETDQVRTEPLSQFSCLLNLPFPWYLGHVSY